MNARHANRVMFVDDEEGVRASWNRFLGDRGFDVTMAEDGETAIVQLLGEEPVDVVVADLRMPGLDGLQLLEWVQEQRPQTPFILITGYGSEEVERKARELGVYEYLNKPISPETLAAVITAASQLKWAKPAKETVQAEPGAEVAESVDVRPEDAVAAVEEPSEAGRFRSALQTAGALVAAPILGLAFVAFLPLIGFVALFWFLGQRLLKGKEVSAS